MAWFRQYILVFFVLGIGVAASVAGFRQFVLIEESEKRRSFVLAASDRLVAIERSIQSNLDSVLSVKSFFESNLVVHREQFRSFVSPMLKRNGALKALEWIPNVPAKDRDEFEAIAKSEGFSNFRFTERDKKGKLVSAGMRENYFPVFYVEPMKGNEGAFGFDLGSSVNRRNALELARDSGRLTTSESITLVQNRRKGVLLFAPIFQAGGPSHTIELRRKNIVGFALGVLEIQNMIAAAFSSRYHLQTPGGIDFFIFGEEKPGGTPPIYIHQSRSRGSTIAPKSSKEETQSGLYLAHTVQIGDRNWVVVAKPVDPNFGAGIPLSAWGVLLLGLILTGTMAVLLKSNVDRSQIVEALVIERTSELSVKSKQIELMHDVTVIANEANSIEVAIQTCINLICTRASWQVGHAYFVSTYKSPRLTPSDIWFFEDAKANISFREITKQTEYETGEGLPGLVFESKEPVYVTDVGDTNFYPRKEIGRGLGLVSSVGMPVMIEKEVVGVLEFFYTNRNEPDESLMKALGHIGTQLGRVFERKKIENMKSEFISTVSHELRTPLTSIKGSLGLIVSGVTGPLTDSLSDMVNIAYNNSDRLVRLINDILDIEKIEVGKMEFKLEVLKLAPLMERVVSENKGYADAAKVTLALNNSEPEALILADSDRIIQAMTNLISNAAKFSPDGSVVKINVSSRNQGYHIAVSDRGPGVPENFRSKIFGKFAQADSVSGQGGTGLGLSISKAIVEEHLGHIGYKTETGVGTTFFIDLPKYHERRERASLPANLPKNAPRVLVCEDDPDIAKLLELMLAEDGVKVDVVHTAADAKRQLLENRYDAMMLDLVLPDQDGISLLQDIRQVEVTRDLPIVVVSAKAVEGKNELNGHAFGIIDWIQKPIDHEYLNRALHRAIRAGAAAKPQILHVEDDLDVARVVSTLVKDVATVTLVTSLAEGKNYLRTRSFDLVVLDLMLPDGAGEDLFAVAHESELAAPPFIVFSAKEIKSSTVSDDIKATLVKSLTSNEQLVATIRSAIKSN